MADVASLNDLRPLYLLRLSSFLPGGCWETCPYRSGGYDPAADFSLLRNSYASFLSDLSASWPVGARLKHGEMPRSVELSVYGPELDYNLLHVITKDDVWFIAHPVPKQFRQDAR